MKLAIRRTSAEASLRLQITEESRRSDGLTPTAWGSADTPRSLLTADIGIEFTVRNTFVRLGRN